MYVFIVAAPPPKKNSTCYDKLPEFLAELSTDSQDIRLALHIMFTLLSVVAHANSG